jgi:hypothetical protein
LLLANASAIFGAGCFVPFVIFLLTPETCLPTDMSGEASAKTEA